MTRLTNSAIAVDSSSSQAENRPRRLSIPHPVLARARARHTNGPQRGLTAAPIGPSGTPISPPQSGADPARREPYGEPRTTRFYRLSAVGAREPRFSHLPSYLRHFMATTTEPTSKAEVSTLLNLSGSSGYTVLPAPLKKQKATPALGALVATSR